LSARSLVRLVRLRAGGHLPDAERLAARARGYVEQCWPRLEEILDRCEAAEVDDRALSRARASFAHLNAVCGRLEAAGFSDDAVASELPVMEAEWDRGRRAMRAIRDELGHRFRADLAGSLARVLDLRADDLEGVAVAVAGERDLSLRIHRDDLEFVLDNLLGNAAEALRDRPGRALSIAVARVDGACRCEVADSGCGMPPGLVERLGRERVSGRVGGGLGWLNSRALLDRYGGSLNVAGSVPGEGTRVVLVVPLAEDPRPEDGDHD
jgi:signal transduction histidine kinase